LHGNLCECYMVIVFVNATRSFQIVYVNVAWCEVVFKLFYVNVTWCEEVLKLFMQMLHGNCLCECYKKFSNCLCKGCMVWSSFQIVYVNVTWCEEVFKLFM
jgi:hypothetical protein